MLSLTELSALATAHTEALAQPTAALIVAGVELVTSSQPVVMGCINLSRDSTYRDSVATSPEAAIRMGRVMSAQGAAIIDVGAESSTAKASRVDVSTQIASLTPVIEELASDGTLVSAETYDLRVVEASLRAGARVVNLTGRSDEDAIFELAAEHRAAVVLCYVGGENVRQITDLELDADPIPALIDHFAGRVERARSHGVEGIVIDPGMGFYYGNLTEPTVRARHQARVLLSSFRLKALGVPICNALPHAFDLFGDQFRTAEGFFAVLAALGGSSILRTHEVPRVLAVLRALQTL